MVEIDVVVAGTEATDVAGTCTYVGMATVGVVVVVISGKDV